MDEDILRGQPTRLASLLFDDGGRSWRADELSSILQHQLLAPIAYDLAGITGEDGAIDNSRIPAGLTSFRDLLLHPLPPFELLLLTKEFAKCSDQRTDAPLPPEIALILYYAVVVAAQLRHNREISSLTQDQIQQGVQWALAQTWLDPGLRPLFLAAKSA